ncbi:helix-turn-helix transcriptional regulator [Roseibium porphyridii]|uniref:Helix-turn-helix transcriptional regulator n=1 Tax=Roseibium porphyridii TaxID=2866279 RepID=A0ABY8F303_9HYPH|nr:helix-turn-helix transcriptional regulator [Roseibium sp. KMA01]WFE89789.1 helix-turn-helix transcriptional regulator [Roseibium sp. KMA01]
MQDFKIAGNEGRLSREEAKQNRRAAGAYIKELRLKRGLTQKELSKLLGLEYYTMISGVENGSNRIPPEALADWAKALRVKPRDFAKRLLSHYEPRYFEALFGK